MLLSQAFPLSEDDFNEEDPDASATRGLERKRLLEEFPNYELLAMRSVALFLAELLEWANSTQLSHLSSSFNFVAVRSEDDISFASQMERLWTVSLHILLSLSAH
jgi:hypothetical protein